MGIIQKISDTIQSVKGSVALANAAAKAYHVGTGNDPETYEAFEADKPVDVAMNLAGSYAVQSATGLIMMMREGKATELGFEQVLRDMAEGKLNEKEKLVARLCANLAWKSGQPFRSLERVTRSPMVDFSLLPEEEQIKDDDQIRAAAKTLLELVGVNVEA